MAKGPGGRPSCYDPSFCDKVIELGKEGASKAEMALELGISRDSFNLYEKEKPEFSEAVKEAVSCAQGWWEKKGREAVFASKDFNATAFIFNMKNRFKEDWSDRVINEHAGAVSIGGLYAAIADRTDPEPV